MDGTSFVTEHSCTSFVRMYLFISLGMNSTSIHSASYSKSMFNNLEAASDFFLKGAALCYISITVSSSTGAIVHPFDQSLPSGVKLYVLWD